MTEHDTTEAGPPSGQTPRRSNRLLVGLATLTAGAVVAGALWMGSAVTTPGPRPNDPLAHAPSGTPVTDADGKPVTGQADPGSTAIALPPIPGAHLEKLAAGWKKDWGSATKATETGYQTVAKVPATGDRVRFGAVRSNTGTRTEASTLFCIVAEVDVDRRFLRSVVDVCHRRALGVSERDELLAWLNAQDYTENVYAVRVMQRFHAEVVFSLSAFSVRLVAKDRTGPGAVPTTDAKPAG